MGRYEITGRTSIWFAGNAIGDVVDTDLDEAVEHALIGQGAIRKLEDKNKPEKAKKRGPAKQNS